MYLNVTVCILFVFVRDLGHGQQGRHSSAPQPHQRRCRARLHSKCFASSLNGKATPATVMCRLLKLSHAACGPGGMSPLPECHGSNPPCALRPSASPGSATRAAPPAAWKGRLAQGPGTPRRLERPCTTQSGPEGRERGPFRPENRGPGPGTHATAGIPTTRGGSPPGAAEPHCRVWVGPAQRGTGSVHGPARTLLGPSRLR